MKYRKLGKTGIPVSVVGIGTYQYGGEWGKDFSPLQVKEILDCAKDYGVNLIDTAECYGDHLSESLIGQAIEGSRQDWVIATKFGHHFLPGFAREDIWDANGVQKQLEASLKALRTDAVDIYMFHSCTNEQLQNDELWTMLQKAKQAGKIKHIGLSLKPAVENNVFQTSYAAEHGVEVIEIVYNRLDRNPEIETFSVCRKNDLGVFARVPLASGLLSGKYQPGVIFPKSDVRSSQDSTNIDARLAQVQEIMEKEVPAGTNMAEWAIAWCLQHNAVSTCIPGFKSVQQLMSGINAANMDMVSDGHPLAVKK